MLIYVIPWISLWIRGSQERFSELLKNFWLAHKKRKRERKCWALVSEFLTHFSENIENNWTNLSNSSQILSSAKHHGIKHPKSLSFASQARILRRRRQAHCSHHVGKFSRPTALAHQEKTRKRKSKLASSWYKRLDLCTMYLNFCSSVAALSFLVPIILCHSAFVLEQDVVPTSILRIEINDVTQADWFIWICASIFNISVV